MKRRRIWILILLGLLVVGSVGFMLRSPGYMDAAYYLSTAEALVGRRGFSEPFLWNYLDDPAGIPHPSHLYWMPAPSVLAAASMRLIGSTWRAAQIPFLLLGAVLPAVAAALAYQLTVDEYIAWIAGLLALFPGFFLPYLGTVDSFALYALIGSALLFLLSRRTFTVWSSLLAGLLIASAHLTRADGVLFFLPAIAAMLTSQSRRRQSFAGLVVGYAAGMSLWWTRNLLTIGVLMPDTSHAFWLTSYDDLFAYPASRLSMQAWLESGWMDILAARLQALIVNSQRTLAEVGMVFLLPFIVLGGWDLKHRRIVWLGGLYYLSLLVLMTVVFPFAGANGGLFHSSAAVLPLAMALAPHGVRCAIVWISARREWDQEQAVGVFTTAAVVILAAFTVWNLGRRVGWSPPGGRWSAGEDTYQRISGRLAREAEYAGIGAVNNPPGFYIATERSTVVIPNGDVSVLMDVIERYDVAWVLLEPNHPRGLAMLYDHPGTAPGLDLRITFKDDQGRAVYYYVVE